LDRTAAGELIARLNADAERIARRFALRYRAIEAEHPRVRRRYGICYSDGTIRIRLRHAATGEALKYSSLVNTLCHELAHLRHFNHGPRFKDFYLTLLAFARREGIYVPRASLAREPQPAPAPAPRAPAPGAAPERPGPRQLTLFG
jgi:predicted metal-dependent hydrolase